MQSYKATIKTKTGIEHVLITASNTEAARIEAARRGWPISLKQSRKPLFESRMSIVDRTVFLQRLASMLASRVSMSEALQVIHDSFGGQVRQVSSLLRQRIEMGENLADAMTAAGDKYFPEAIVAIVRTGQHGGDISHALREAARFEIEMEEVKKESSQGMWSAGMGFVTGVIVLFASTLYVGPMMMELEVFKAGKSAVDISWVITLSSVLNWFVGAIVVLLLIFGLLVALLKPLFPSKVDLFISKIPFYRDLILAKRNYIVFFGLAVLLAAGLRLEECLRLARDNAPSGRLRDDLERARKAIVSGSSKPWPYVMRTLHPTDQAALATAQNRTHVAMTISDLALQYRNLYRQRVSFFVPLAQVLAAIFLSLAGIVLFGVAIIPMLQITGGILNAT